MVDVYIFKFKKRKGELVAPVLPFLNHSEETIDHVEFHYIGNEKTLTGVSRMSELASTNPIKEALNREILRLFREKSKSRLNDDVSFIGVKVTEDKEYSSGDYENKVVFNTDLEPLVGDYFLMSFAVGGQYESREMQTLDGVMKDSKLLAQSEERSYINRYATFLLRLEKVDKNRAFFSNFGIVAENMKLIYRANLVFDKAKRTRNLARYTKPLTILDSEPEVSTVVSNTGTIAMRTITNSVFYVPKYFKDYHIKVPKNRRISYVVHPYELLNIKDAVQLPSFRSIISHRSVVHIQDYYGLHKSVLNRFFTGIIKKEFYYGFSDRLSPLMNTGTWGFFLYTVPETKYLVMTELKAEDVYNLISRYDVKLQPELEEFTKVAVMLDNYIESVREKVRRIVEKINEKNYKRIVESVETTAGE